MHLCKCVLCECGMMISYLCVCALSVCFPLSVYSIISTRKHWSYSDEICWIWIIFHTIFRFNQFRRKLYTFKTSGKFACVLHLSGHEKCEVLLRIYCTGNKIVLKYWKIFYIFFSGIIEMFTALNEMKNAGVRCNHLVCFFILYF